MTSDQTRPFIVLLEKRDALEAERAVDFVPWHTSVFSAHLAAHGVHRGLDHANVFAEVELGEIDAVEVSPV